MVITVVSVEVVQSAVNQEVDVVAMRNFGVAAAGTVSMVSIVAGIDR